MAEQAQKRILYIVRRPPYAGGLARATVDAALAAAAFEQAPLLLFLGEGVLSLQAGQDSTAIGQKNLGKLLASLPLYDIESVYADAQALARYGVSATEAPVPVTALAADELRALLDSSDHLVGG